VPVPTLKRDETSPSDTCDGFGTSGTSFGKEFTKAFCAIRLVFSGCEPLASQGFLTVGTCEALPVPRVVAVSHATLSDNLVALDAFGGEFVFVAFCAINVMFLGNERLGSDRVLAGATYEASLVPLTRLVLHLLHTCSEDISASVASGGELSVVAGAAIYSVGFGAELFVHQRRPAFGADEARLVPMLLLVRQIL